jgi:5-bromo-4-chloroindolyl phosphate hydrolysis protein
MKITCQKCNKEENVRVGVSLFLDIPTKFYARLSKKNVMSAETKFQGAGWDKAYFYCEDCGWSTHLTEVSYLKKELEKAQKKIKEMETK